jgi:glyoxylase-like metal-dependent hydrolase (beta-lactamase superfamily II)
MEIPETLTPEYMAQLKQKMFDNVGHYPLRKQFSLRLAKPDTWIVNCYSPSLEAPHPHVLIGGTYTLVIDTTDTPYDLRSYLTQYVTDQPIKVASTHSHGDHTLGNGLFNDCEIYMSAPAWQEIRESREKGWTDPRQQGHIMGDYVPTILKPGDVIDLGGRELEVLPYKPCHSPTSLIYLDRTYGILFPGDEIDSGQINMWNMSVEDFRENMVSLKQRAGDFDMICPAHNGTPMHAKILDYYIENCDRILSGIEGDMDKGSTSYLLNPFESRPPKLAQQRRWDPDIRRSEWKGTALNYNIHKIFRD